MKAVFSSITQVSFHGIGKAPFAERENLSGIYPVHNVRYLSGSDRRPPLTLSSPPGRREERVNGCRHAGKFEFSWTVLPNRMLSWVFPDWEPRLMPRRHREQTGGALAEAGRVFACKPRSMT